MKVAMQAIITIMEKQQLKQKDMKLKKTGLRIGSFINFWSIDDTWKVTQIKNGAELDFILEKEEEDLHQLVPIGRDWVERFEYKFKEKGWSDMFISTSFLIDDETPVEVHFVVGPHYKKISYVHELQNLYFDYVGEELKEKEECHEH